MSNVNFVTNGKKIYTLADNDWYAVWQDDEKVTLIDTDCKVAGDTLETTWSDTNDDNGQNILNFTNALADKYFSKNQICHCTTRY